MVGSLEGFERAAAAGSTGAAEAGTDAETDER